MQKSASDSLYISEVFSSIQGEGVYVGLPMTFIRLQGCPYRCTWCDSEYTWPLHEQGLYQTIDSLIEQCKAYGNQWVCVTGGEPLIQRQVWQLFRELHANNFLVECETSGAVLIRDGFNVNWVVDMKCPASGMDSKNLYSNLELLTAQDQIKFVVQDYDDFDWAVRLLYKYRDALQTPRPTVLFSPVQGLCNPADIVEWLKTRRYRLIHSGFDKSWRLSIQVHKVVWPDIERGV